MNIEKAMIKYLELYLRGIYDHVVAHLVSNITI